jgi:hypothetical protein
LRARRHRPACGDAPTGESRGTPVSSTGLDGFMAAAQCLRPEASPPLCKRALASNASRPTSALSPSVIRPPRIWAVHGLVHQRLGDSNTPILLVPQPVVERQKSAESPAYQTIAKVLVLIRRLWADLVDGLAGVVPSNADHRLSLIAQPLGLGRGGFAQIVVVGLPTKLNTRGLLASVVMESSAALVLVVIQSRLRARWLLRIVNMLAALRRRLSSLRRAS